MNYLPFLHLFCFFVYAYMAGFLLYKDSKSLVNRACAALMICFSIWNFSDIFTRNIYLELTGKTAMLLQNISSFGWLCFPVAMLYFAIAFSRNEKIFKSNIFRFIVIVLPALLIYKEWTNGILINPVKQYYGWAFTWSNTIWTYLFYAYYVSFVLISIYFVYMYGKKAERLLDRKQSKAIVISISIGLIAGTISDVIIPVLDIWNIPSLSDVFILFFAIGIVYAIVKYKFLAITPATAAENIISSMKEFFILLDQDKKIIAVNKSIISSSEYDSKELEKGAVKSLFKENSPIITLLGKVINGEIVKNQEDSIITKNGKEIPIIFSCSLLKSKEGSILGIVFIARDITERKKSEEEKEKLQAKLLQSEKMATLGQLAGKIANEIDSPMSAIVGFAETIVQKVKDDDPLYMPLKSIEREAIRCKKLISDLLTFLQYDKIEKEKVNINEIIEQTVSLIETQVRGRNIQIVKNYDYGLPDILIDKNQIQQIIVNLCNNAIDAMPDGGTITVSTQSVIANEEKQSLDGIVVSKQNDSRNDKFIEIYISDTGQGISEEVKKRMFEPFFTTKEVGKGTGLGLSLVYEIIQKYNGTIEVESEAGKGTTFTIKFPAI